MRFGIAGLISNVTFMVGYNTAIYYFEHLHPASVIYSAFYLLFIPVGHAITSLLVFGWPSPYLPNLLSNAPIGLTAMVVGTALTQYLDNIDFNERFEDMLYRTIFGLTPVEDEKGEFYSSVVVTLTTGIWSYVFSMIVNSSGTGKGKKEL